ncbi:ribbon-helix-helix domain-containing protein [Synechocystis sp. B12]|uniref:ribbon-helix-helix domain-containing protein n=1 Tax=unclassified Synechocystis TaxID=2640012 RepID=UPI0001E13B45|nr:MULTISPECIES: ribbon-helix-helix domain-containing protein [unclassified Synechocystis]WLT37885.1 ribbon-helix-helix domain-containing protein [Synechocystis sp. B12]AVP90048.1 ribbon-helix-helix protein, CopG family [Synechocystis sp. IPPAS B-1465]MCW5240185.1 ribbon-helix-helix protein, CopG family [Synechocystis sp. PCC 6803]NHL97967.1 ribbon-helix-helix protein, CopG family [Synechocystis sp. PCC 6803]QHV00443.1 ribbon-helix-helix protein, CopG family [Synechocystis sp. CACIAM 05]
MIRTKPKSDKVLTIRLPEKDLVHLERYCAAEGRTKTEVLRQLIRNLPTVPD